MTNLTNVQIFLAVFVLFVTVAVIWFGVLRPKRRPRLEPPQPVPISFKQAQDEVKARVAVHRQKQAGGKDAA